MLGCLSPPWKIWNIFYGCLFGIKWHAGGLDGERKCWHQLFQRFELHSCAPPWHHLPPTRNAPLSPSACSGYFCPINYSETACWIDNCSEEAWLYCMNRNLSDILIYCTQQSEDCLLTQQTVGVNRFCMLSFIYHYDPKGSVLNSQSLMQVLTSLQFFIASPKDFSYFKGLYSLQHQKKQNLYKDKDQAIKNITQRDKNHKLFRPTCFPHINVFYFINIEHTLIAWYIVFLNSGSE